MGPETRMGDYQPVDWAPACLCLGLPQPATGQLTFDCHVGHGAHTAAHLAQVDAVVVRLQPVDDEAADRALLDLLVLAAGQQSLVLTEPGSGNARVGDFTLQHRNSMLPALHVLQRP